MQCGYAKTLYIYIYLYNVPKPVKLSDLVGKDLSQIALFHFSISHFKSSSISPKMEHWNISLFSMTYRHTQRNIVEHYSTLHCLPPFNTIYSSISRPDTFYSHLTLVTKYDTLGVWARMFYPTATLWAPHNTTREEHVMTKHLVICSLCGDDYPQARRDIGYYSCLSCGDKEATETRLGWTIVPTPKGHYTRVTNLEELKHLNQKIK